MQIFYFSVLFVVCLIEFVLAVGLALSRRATLLFIYVCLAFFTALNSPLSLIVQSLTLIAVFKALHNKQIIGLTGKHFCQLGGIACGKSLVSEYLLQNGIAIIDCDKIAKQVLQAGQPAFAKVVKAFGQQILQENGQIDRKLLRKIVFNNKLQMFRLRRIVLFYICKQIFSDLVKNLRANKTVILDAPLLIEYKFLYFICKKVIVVATIDNQTVLERLMQRDNISAQLAAQMIKSQIPIQEKLKYGDYVFLNHGTKQELLDQVELSLNSILR